MGLKMQPNKKNKLSPQQEQLKKLLMPIVEGILKEFGDEKPHASDKTDRATVQRSLIPFLTKFSEKTGIIFAEAQMFTGSLRNIRYFVQNTPDGLVLKADYEYDS